MYAKVMTKMVLFLVIVLAASSSNFICSELYAATKTVELSFNHMWPADSWPNKVFTAYAEEIYTRTNGKIKINLFPGGILSKPAQVYDSVIKRTSDMGASDIVYTPNRFPLMEALPLTPWGAKSAWQNGRVANEIYKKFKPVEFNDTEVMFFWGFSPSYIQSTKPALTLTDLEGLKMRTTLSGAAMLEALKMVPITIPMSETYMAIQRGMCDGTTSPLETLQSFRLAEVVKYTIDVPIFAGIWYIVMNKGVWNGLSAESKQVFYETNEKYIDVISKTYDEKDQEGKEFSLNLGNKIITLPDEDIRKIEEYWQPITEKWISQAESKGLPGRAVVTEILRLKEKYK